MLHSGARPSHQYRRAAQSGRRTIPYTRSVSLTARLSPISRAWARTRTHARREADGGRPLPRIATGADASVGPCSAHTDAHSLERLVASMALIPRRERPVHGRQFNREVPDLR